VNQLHGGLLPITEAVRQFQEFSKAKEAIVQALVAAGADLAKLDGEGRTPLQAMKGKSDVVRALLSP
jgi:hypothetical protein